MGIAKMTFNDLKKTGTYARKATFSPKRHARVYKVVARLISPLQTSHEHQEIKGFSYAGCEAVIFSCFLKCIVEFSGMNSSVNNTTSIVCVLLSVRVKDVNKGF